MSERPTLTATATLPSKPPPVARREGGRLNFTARSLKVTLVLDPAQLAELHVPSGAGPQRFRITVGERRLTGRLNAKGLRKATALIAEHGVERVAVVLSGKLEAGDEISEAGLMATVKAPKGEG